MAVPVLLHALAALSSGEYQPLTINAATGNVSWGAKSAPAAPDLYCNVPFNPRAGSFTLQSKLDLTTVNASTGAVITHATLPSPPDNWSGSGYAASGAVLWALGYPATDNGTQSLWAIDPSTGAVDVKASGFDVYNGLLPCVFTVSPSASHAYWLTDFPGFHTIITTAHLNSSTAGQAKVSSTLYRGDGAILALTAYALPGNATEQVLGLDVKGERGPLLVSIDPRSGAATPLYTFDVADEVDDEGSLAYDGRTGVAYLLLARPQAGNSSVASRTLHAVDLTATPPKITSRPLPGLPGDLQGVFGLGLAVGAA